MCGISVVINRHGERVKEDIVHSMNNRVTHRGPDDQGIYLESNFGFGHRRLSILDLSSAGHQPMERGNYILTYNGEIYNYLELRQELIEKGYSFDTQTDSEVIIASYDQWGKDCLNKFNGMWSFSIFDREKNILFCSRDRFGIKPFVYTKTSDFFAIASEIKQFLDIPDFNAKPNHSTIFQYLYESSLTTNENTFFENVEVLKGGHFLIYHLTNNEVEIDQWYDINKVQMISRRNLSLEEAGRTFSKLLSDSIKIRLRSDVNVGACLSGGLDSSSIVCIAQQHSGNVQTVSSCYDDPSYDEQEYIDIINDKYSIVSHKVFPNLEDLINKKTLTKIIYHQDQPILSASHFSEYKVFETAADKKLTVMLDGQGADEYLAGYGEFFLIHWKNLLHNGKIWTLLKEINERSRKQNEPAFANIKRLLHMLFLGKLKEKLKNIAISHEKASPSWMNDKFYNKYAKDKNSLHNPFKHIHNIYSLSKYELISYSLPYQLHSEDRNSMLHSIESRLPFLDVNLVEFCLSLPNEYKINDGATKVVLRKGMIKLLPKEILNRHDKIGFAAPDQVWMRKEKEVIRKELTSAIENMTAIIKSSILEDYEIALQSDKSVNPIFFKVICLNHWLKAFNLKLNTQVF